MKTLVAEGREEVVTWLSGKAPLEVELVPGELVRTAVRVSDQVLSAVFPGNPPQRRFFHIELQTAGDSNMNLRMLEYWVGVTGRLFRGQNQFAPLSSCVMYLDRKQYTPDPGQFSADDGEGTGCRFRYRVVKLWEVEPAQVLGFPRPGLAPLAPLMKTRDPVETVVQSKRAIVEASAREVSRQKKAELCGALFALAGLVIDDRDLLFRLIWEDWMGLERSVTVQWLMEKGRAKGVEEGMQTGLLDARRDDILAVLESRFGAVEEGLRKRILDIQDAEALRGLLRQAVSAPTFESFRALLP